jgi:ATP-dependent Clp protease protease subunit
MQNWRMDDDEEKKEKEDKKEKEETPLAKEIAESFLKQRKIFLWSPVDDESAERLVKQFLYLDSKSHDEITLFINSPGGVVSSGLAVYDVMQALKSPVATVVSGQAASFGAVLLAAGTKGRRYAWPNSRVMIHQPLIQGHMFGPASDIEIQAEEMLRIHQTLNKILSHHSGQPVDKIERDTDRDNHMTGEQAKAYGLVDHVETRL